MFRLSSPHSHEDGLVLPAKNWEKLEGLGEGLAFIANSAAHILYLFFCNFCFQAHFESNISVKSVF